MVRRRIALLALAVTVLLAGGAATTQLRPTSSAELLVSPESTVAQATRTLDRRFGAEPIAVAIDGDLTTTLAPANLVRLVDLEGRIARSPGVRSVYGPGTFVNQTIVQIGRVVERELGVVAKRAERVARVARKRALEQRLGPAVADRRADEARRRALGAKAREYADLLVRFGSVGAPALTNTRFVSQLVFGAGIDPKRRFQWLFPDARHAVILVRPDRDVAGNELLALGRRLRRLAIENGPRGVRTRVAGVPLVAAALEDQTRAELIRIAPIALVAMLVLLLIVLRGRRARVLPLALAAGALILAVGLSWPLGLGLTTSTVAALPVVLGLGLDFAIQLQARYWAERAAGTSPEPAARAARSSVGPTLTLAATAMTAGFLVLTASPVPLIDRLGLILAVGTITALGTVLIAGPPLLAILDREPTTAPLSLRVPRRVTSQVFRPSVKVVLIACAVGGFVLSGRTQLESDLAQLAPSDLREVREARDVQRSLGTSGTLRVAVRSDNLTDPAVVNWMADVGQRVLALDPRLRPGPNLGDLITAGGAQRATSGAAVDRLVRLLPRYILAAVMSRDRRLAELTFGVPFVSVAEQGEIVERIRALLQRAPPGVSATPGGLLASAAASTRALERSRPELLLAAALLIGIILAVAWRDPARVALVVGPALLAAGLCALALALIGVRLSPLGAALEPLVLAVGLEFGMLLDMRYRQARAAGLSPAAARDETTRTIGGAVALSASTVTVGFAVLLASNVALLRQFGFLVAVEIAICAVVALVIVPAAAEYLDSREGARAPRTRLRLSSAEPSRRVVR